MLPNSKVMSGDNAASSFSDDSSNKSPPTTLMLKEELYQELDELLTAFRSEAQQQFCLDQGIMQKDDLETLQHTVQQFQYSLKINNHPHQHQQLLPSLTRIIQTILQHYSYACQERNMRLLDEYLTNQYITDWHRLKQQWDLKAKENQYLHLILEDIILLSQSWRQHHHSNSSNENSTSSSSKPIVMMTSLSTLPKRLSSATKRSSLANKRNSTPVSPSSAPPPSSSTVSSFQSSSSSTSEDILTSILTTFDYPPGAYMVTIDKHNYKQLGLQHSKIGTRQIIFDSHQLSTNNIILIMRHLSDAFASLFAATAQTHLATIDTQIKKAHPFYTINAMKQLLAQIMVEESSMTQSLGYGSHYMDHPNDYCCDSEYHTQQKQHQQPPTLPSSITPHHRASRTSTSSPPTSLAVLTPFRLSSPAPSNQPWHHPIPIPSFAPAPWQLPDLLKPRYPYNPLLFGILRRKTGSITSSNNSNEQHQQHIPTSSTSSSFLKYAFSSSQSRMTPRATRTSASPPAPVKAYRTTTATNSKKNFNGNAPNRSAPHHYHASSSATANDSSDNNHQAPPIRPPPRVSTLGTSSSVLQQKQQRRHENGGASSGRSKRYLHPVVMQDREDKMKATAADDESDQGDDNWLIDDNQDKMVTSATGMAAPFTSVSVNKLSFYLGKIAGQFYQDLLTHTRVRYQEAREALEVLECQMQELYRHLQLASSRAVMHRALMIVQELDGQQQQQQQQQPHEQQQYYYYPHQHSDCQQQQPGQCSDFGCSTTNSSSLPPQQQLYSDPSSHDGTETTDSVNYNNNCHDQQATAKPTTNRWTPICIDNYQDKANADHNDQDAVAINEKEQINTTPPHFYHAMPPSPDNVTMSETTIQAELISQPPKDVIHHSKLETITTQCLENPTSITS